MYNKNKEKYQRRFNDLKNEAAVWIPVWKDISKYIVPTRGFYEGMLPNGSRKIDHRVVLNGAPDQAVTTAAAGITSGLTSPSRPWFKLGLPRQHAMLSELKPVKNWLEDCKDAIMDVYAQSNIYKMFHGMYEELLGFGTGCTLILDDYDDVIRAKTLTAGEYLLGVDSSGRVDTFAREFSMTCLQMIEEFGIDNVSDNVKAAYINNETTTYFKVKHIIEANDDRIKERLDNQNMAFRSVYWEDGNTDQILAKRGFEEFPVLAPRWMTVTSGDVYGVGPGWKALGDVKMLYKMISDKSAASSKVLNPPLLKDSSVDGEVNAFPGGLTSSSSIAPNTGVRAAYQINPDMNAIREDIRETKKDIADVFYADLFLMMQQLDSGRMTAREVVERHEEKLQILGPAIENLQNELLGPCINITFNRMFKANLLPPPPPELEGMTITVEYISTLAQAQKALSSTSIEQVIGFVGEMAQIYPDALDNINADEAALEYAEVVGVPSRVIRGRDEVAALRDAKAAAMQAQQEQDQEQQAIQSAKMLSETKVGQGDNALDKVTEGM